MRAVELDHNCVDNIKRFDIYFIYKYIKMRIAIVGAGSAGLAALRHVVLLLAAENTQSQGKITQVVCYEKTNQVGGTWVYTTEIGVDHYGLPIHSSMYDSLR